MFLTDDWKPTTQLQVYTVLRAALIDGLDDPQFTDKTVFYSMDPHPRANVRENVFITLSPGEGSFDQEILTGAGQEDCRESSSVIMSVFSQQRTDQIGRADDTFLGLEDNDKSRSLFDLKRRLLKLFVNRMLYDPVDEKRLLTEPMQPHHASHPTLIDPEGRRPTFSLIFSLDFAWDLT